MRLPCVSCRATASKLCIISGTRTPRPRSVWHKPYDYATPGGDDAARVVNEPYKHSHAPQAPPVMVKEIRLIADFLSMFFESSLSLRIVHYICGSPLYTLFWIPLLWRRGLREVLMLFICYAIEFEQLVYAVNRNSFFGQPFFSLVVDIAYHIFTLPIHR